MVETQRKPKFINQTSDKRKFQSTMEYLSCSNHYRTKIGQMQFKCIV